jgi:hypothetical protein
VTDTTALSGSFDGLDLRFGAQVGLSDRIDVAGGDVTFDPGSLLLLDAFTAAIHETLGGIGMLSFGGVLELRLLQPERLVVGDRLQLLEFQQLAAHLMPSQFRVVGLDPALLDTSRLSLDGSVTVVPEPGGASMLVAGLALLVAWRRYTRRATV